MNRDVALNPLRAHDEAWAQLARIAQHNRPSARPRAFRHGIHGDQRGVGIGAPRDDTDRTAVQARIGRLLARGEETVGVEVEPRGRSRHAIALYEEEPPYSMGSQVIGPCEGLTTAQDGVPEGSS